MLQWGRGLKTPEIAHLCIHWYAYMSFNGAGVLRPRKSVGPRLDMFARKPLQWGRGLKTPEMAT